MSVEERRAREVEMRNERKSMEQQGIYKRPSAKEHCDRVKFDYTLVEKRLPDNGFRLAYPKEAPG